MTQDHLLKAANFFLTHAFEQLDHSKIKIEPNWHIDHICFRTSTEAEYQSKKSEFSKFGELLTESPVNGRLISTFKLYKPIFFKDFQIDLIELPAPKSEKKTEDGFEHLEVVIDIGFKELRSKYPLLKFEDSGLKKDFNQELEIELNNCAVKFHHLSLESVVNLEKNRTVHRAIEGSGVLHLLKDFNPLIAGTFPLDLNVEKSDVDVLLSHDNLSLIAKEIRSHFKNTNNFKLQMLAVENEPTVISNFEFQGIEFEIFAQRITSVQQSAYKHFLIEERLLKTGGINLKNEVLRQRKLGFKTEPAFANALGLTGDPYLELLKLQVLDNNELKARIAHNDK